MSYSCSACGYRSVKWMGFCPQCRHDAPLQELATVKTRASEVLSLEQVGETPEARRSTGIGELDRVLGGGVVAGSTILVGGEPGVGKSTLLLQAAGSIAAGGGRVLIATAEESPQQVGMRAERLRLKSDDVLVVGDHNLDQILDAASSVLPDLLVIDSIQTVTSPDAEGSAGGSAQVRESAARLMRFAKETNVATVLVGHVTKDGSIAGPKLVEHMVDVVLYFEGDPDLGLRSLRSLKNRFGSTNVVGMFEMAGDGLSEVLDPSRLFLGGWQYDVPGTVVFPALEGRRAILVEVQALAVQTTLAQPRRSVRGVDPNRVHQILAVIHRRIGLQTSHLDVYLNVVGGWKVDEPACDLAVALALVSAVEGQPLGSTAAWGEVGLTGEVRSVPLDLRRRQEAERVGIERLVTPLGIDSIADGVTDLQAALLRAGLR